ncbi:MAG: aminopeptidase P family protein [Myxococcales bacterium]|nr:MAG: aminopeptidase P family protein [Myxococcales bacterium]
MVNGNNSNPIRFGASDLFARYDLDLIWIKGLATIKYLAGFTGSTANLLVSPDKKQILCVDGRYTTQAQEECKGTKVVEIQKPIEDLCAKARELGAKTLGFEANQATYADFALLQKELPGVTLAPIEENLACLRIVKKPLELQKLRRANALAHQAFTDLVGVLRPGMTEKEAAWFIDRRFRELGGAGNSFETLICAGPRSAIVHGKPTERKFQTGDFIIIDRGVIADHYVSDETNTFVLGRADAKQREVYQVVKDAHDKCIEAVKPGMSCVDLDAVAREYIRQKGFGDFFGHGTGHGVGLEVHEQPVISPRGSGWIEEGMVFSVEPGVYIPDWGGVRVEDVVVVTKDGCDILTPADKNQYELKVE